MPAPSIFATDGTRAHLTDAGLENVRPVSELTETNEILGGRVKTLHPKIFAGLLARRDKPDHLAQLAEQDIEQIDLVVVNLYPFAQTVREPATSLDQALEQIDIGGVALLRAAAKNFPGVAAVVEPDAVRIGPARHQDAGLGQPGDAPEARGRGVRPDRGLRRADRELPERRSRARVFPTRLTMVVEKKADLRYGENPHQLGAFYTDPAHAGGSISAAHQIAGKDLSFNNLLDLDAAWTIASDFKTPAVAIVKHGNPCGLASVVDLAEAFRLALEGDSRQRLRRGDRREPDHRRGRRRAPSAPASSRRSWRRATRPRRSRSCGRSAASRSSRCRRADSEADELGIGRFDFKRIGGGLLVQTFDEMEEDRDKLQPVTQRRPTLEELTDLLFAWRAVRHVKSNAVVLAKKHAMVGMGAGQPSRVVSVEVALRKAGERAPLSVMASDAYFPFPDGIQIAAQAGVTAIIQPGGSIRDEMAIEVADRHHMAMVFTGRRHFKH